MVRVTAQRSLPLFHRGPASALGHVRAFVDPARNGQVLLLRVNYRDGTNDLLHTLDGVVAVNGATSELVFSGAVFDALQRGADNARGAVVTNCDALFTPTGLLRGAAIPRACVGRYLKHLSARHGAIVLATTAPWPTRQAVETLFGPGVVTERECARTTERAFAGALRRAFGLDPAQAEAVAYFGPNLDLIERIALTRCCDTVGGDTVTGGRPQPHPLCTALGRAPFDTGVAVTDAEAASMPWLPARFTLHGGRVYAASRAVWDEMGNRHAAVDTRAAFVARHLLPIREQLYTDPLMLQRLLLR